MATGGVEGQGGHFQTPSVLCCVLHALDYFLTTLFRWQAIGNFKPVKHMCAKDLRQLPAMQLPLVPCISPSLGPNSVLTALLGSWC